MIKLSVVTINRNNVKGLEATIKSVLGQTSQDFEYLIIDGASTDGSKELVQHKKRNNKQLSYWCSEPDTGIYNAMNKGIQKAKGTYCLFMNSGDTLSDKQVLNDFIHQDFKQDIVYADINHVDGNKYIRTVSIPEKLNFDYFWWQSLPHQSTFIKRELFTRLGYYNENFNYFSDWEFILKALVLNNCTYKHYNKIIANYDINGVSSSRNEEIKTRKEKERENMFLSLMPMVYSSYNQVLLKLGDNDKELQRFLNLYNGKFGFILKFIEFIKKIKRVS